MYPYKIAIIDDNQAVLDVLKLTLEEEFESIVTLTHPSFFTPFLSEGEIDAVVLDMNFNSPNLDGAEGINWLRYIKGHPNAPAIVMMTAFGNNKELIKKLLKAIRKNASRQQEKEEIEEAHLLKEQQEAAQQMTLDEMKRKHVMDILEQCKGNLREAAKRLDINRQTLYNQLKKYGILHE